MFARVTVALLLFVAFAFAQLPSSYNTRDKFPECTIPILNQGNCGSCWAHSTVEALSERFCIHSQGKFKPLLSPQYLANCDTGSSGCGGGDTLGAYNYITIHGNDLTSCTAYTSGQTGRTGPCPSTCDNKEAIIPQNLYYTTKGYSLLSGSTEKNCAAMQEDIFNNGPISASFVVRQDFLDFFKNNATKTSVYKSTYGRTLGGHAIMIVGWGSMDVNGTETPYWQAVNSWGNTWGDNGMFKIIRGLDDCNIESRRLSAGIPNLNRTVAGILNNVQYNTKPVETKVNEASAAVCDGCWVNQKIDEELEAKVQNLLYKEAQKNNGFAFNQMESLIEVRTRVVNGVMYRISVSAKNSEVNEAPRRVNIIAVESAHEDDLSILSVSL